MAYWAFTLTDGALRMLVLLFLHEQGYGPLALASLFLFYEFFGILTNFFGGLLATQIGLKAALVAGLTLQIVALVALGWQAAALSIPFVMVAQAASGIAKDLVKMASKSWVKLAVTPGDASRLMYWVSVLTGSKNALKGFGFFLGGALLTAVGFAQANFGMAAFLTLATVLSLLLLPGGAGKSTAKVKVKQMLSRDTRLNRLSLARFFLFGSRDAWFVVALPVFLTATLGLTHAQTGAFLALWVVGYGFAQSLTPRVLKTAQSPPSAKTAARWTTCLAPILALLLIALWYLGAEATARSMILTLAGGLGLFGFVFAMNSAIHSFLVVHWAQQDKVAADIGFYYSANAAGRLVGTILSGWLFQLAGQGVNGLLLCLLASFVFVVASSCILSLSTFSKPILDYAKK
ncbi:MAG: organoarsenical effux MFS transporter ArsJ [Planctomycetes bacterium]|nr:organoarsenical effux MFS transporter ArsJ [Planctomycetota bacterium]